LIESLRAVRIGVVGDYCVDAYWAMDPAASERSVETGLATRPVRGQRYELGGAGNIVNNLLALGVGQVTAFGVVGDDPFGREMARMMAGRGADRSGLLIQDEAWNTPVYIKPIRDDREEERLDFGGFNVLRDTVATELMTRLRAAVKDLDALIVNQQLRRGIHTPLVQKALNELFWENAGKVFIVDARDLSASYEGCLHKLNDLEATTLCGGTHRPGDAIVLEEARAAAGQLQLRWQKPTFVTRGARGCLVADSDGQHLVPGLHLTGPIDAVGAGDSMLAGIAAALAAGRSAEEAACFGNFVAGVTVQKLFQTGTASPAEVLAIGTDPDYVYEPELADDPRKAVFWQGTEIEVVISLPERLRVTHAIFDHDGTISTLRQGWEAVMEPMMIKAILGDRYASADETLYGRVVKRVREFIDKTTGIQTLVQMQGLVCLVREFGVVPEQERLDEFRYKAIFLDTLMTLVHERLGKLVRHELDVTDFTVKKAPEFLRRLQQAGVKLYLASGTDEKDVIAEAEALGYAPLFEGRIYGAVGDVSKEAKRMVLDRILRDIGEGQSSRLVTFGDGPVEIRETRKRNGLTIGLASDEVCRHGLNPAKRSRLIRAGAQVVVPDYSQSDAMLRLLGLS
jgi:rfaE bifunctional protein kinase chain/domain